MGSSESKSLKIEAEKIQRQKKQLEADRRQIREQYWRDQQLREEQKQKETAQEWQRQADLRQLRRQQQNIQKELEQQKELRKLEQEKVQKQQEEQRLLQVRLEEQRLKLQLLHQQQFQQVFTIVTPAASPSTSFALEETVVVQQKALTVIKPTLSKTNEEPKIKEAPKTKEVSKLKEEPKTKEESRTKEAPKTKKASKLKEEPKTKEASKLKEEPKTKEESRTKEAPKTKKSIKVKRRAKDKRKVKNEGSTKLKEEPKTKEVQKSKEVPELKEMPKVYPKQMNESNIKYAEWSIIDYIQTENCISKTVAENIMKLFDDNNTIPFIARYRRHLTQGMDAEKLKKVRNSYEQAKLIKQRVISIIKDIQDKSQWTPEFHAFIHETKSLADLEQINSFFKTAKSKVAKRAAEMGLEMVAEECVKNRTPTISELLQKSVNSLKTKEEVKDGIVCLMADIIIRDRGTFDIIKKLQSKHSVNIQTAKIQHKGVDNLNKNDNKYESYYNFTSLESDLRPEQVFAINRGEAMKVLSVTINIPDEFQREFKKQCLQQYGFTGYMPLLKETLMDTAIDFAYNRSIKRSVAKRTRQEINERAQNAALDYLAQNVSQRLLAPPVRGKVVIGISPGFQCGCKLAVVSEQGKVLETRTIYPHIANKPNGKIVAEHTLVRMVRRYKCTIFALGTGIASKETEVFLVHVINNKNISLDVYYTFVDSREASIYSREAVLEFPDLEAGIVCAVSIARRLQDPMAELVKIESELLTAEMYQQDISEKQRVTKINEIIVEVVSHVGVDVNTASLSLLKRVAGLDDAKANNIIEWRKSCGPFISRSDLLKVSGIDKRIFEQCAGFIRIVPETVAAISGQQVSQDSFNCFDQTWIHPESYNAAKSLLEVARCNVLQLGTSSFIFTLNLYAQTGNAVLANRFGTTAETIEMIVQGLMIEKGQDIRGKEDSTMFRTSVIRYNDLNNGDVLTGVVIHLAAFGAFVDVGAEVDGLIHKNFMNGRTVEKGQKVEVKVSTIQKERGRLGLTLIKCV